MPGRLQDKVAIVTGAGSAGPGWGNGKATAVLFAREGAKVIAVDVRAEAAAETAGIIMEEGGVVATHICDVSKADAVQRMVAACLDRFGRIDVLHNNVGIVKVGGPVDVTEAEWQQVMDVNLKSMFLTCKYVLPVMEKQGSGAIVNISSSAAIRWTGVPYIAYSTTKGAILPFTRSIALQYAAKGIRANCILPGLMDVPMVRLNLTAAYGADGDLDNLLAKRNAQCPMGKMGDAWDTAYAALFLASEEAKYITGAELAVDGGITCKFA